MSKGFFNYLVFRLSTLNLTVLYVSSASPLARTRTKLERVGECAAPWPFSPIFNRRNSLKWKTSNWFGANGETSTKLQRIFAHVNVSVMLFLADWKWKSQNLLIKNIHPNEPISSLTSIEMGENLLMEKFAWYWCSRGGERERAGWKICVGEKCWLVEEEKCCSGKIAMETEREENLWEKNCWVLKLWTRRLKTC